MWVFRVEDTRAKGLMRCSAGTYRERTSTKGHTAMARITFFELTASNTQAERTFFAEVFGWTFTQYGDGDYWLATTGAAGERGIDGAIMAPPMPDAPRVTNTLAVDDIDATIEAALAAGAKIAVPKNDIPGYAHLAYLQSPTGIVFGVVQYFDTSM